MCCPYIGCSSSSSLHGLSVPCDICAVVSETICNIIAGTDALRGNSSVARAPVNSQITRSIPETQQLCAMTSKTAVRTAHKLHIREYRNCQPFFLSWFFSIVRIVSTEPQSTVFFHQKIVDVCESWNQIYCPKGTCYFIQFEVPIHNLKYLSFLDTYLKKKKTASLQSTYSGFTAWYEPWSLLSRTVTNVRRKPEGVNDVYEKYMISRLYPLAWTLVFSFSI